MKINDVTLAELALALGTERKRQKLSREDAAAVCGVSTSFIRDAESKPENCSLGKLAKLINGLGLSLEVSGLATSTIGLQPAEQRQGDVQVRTNSRDLVPATKSPHQADFGVPKSQLVEPIKAKREPS